MARRRRDKRRRGAAPVGSADGPGPDRRTAKPARGDARPPLGQATAGLAGIRRDTRPEAATPAEPPPRPAAGPPSRRDAHRAAAEPPPPAARATAEQPRRPSAGGSVGPDLEPSAAGGRSSALRRRRWPVWAAAAVVAGVLVYAGVSQARRAVYAARLPDLPELSGQPPALREHLETADRAARDRPTSAEAVGALGLAYHADLFLDHADRAYAAAEALEGGAWRWTYYRALAAGTRGDTDALADGLRRVAAAAPDFGPAWWRLGEAEFKAGRYGRAAEAWHRVPAPGEPAAAAPGPAAAPAAAAAPATVAGAGSARPAPGPPVSAYAALGLARVALVEGDAAGAARLMEDATAAATGFGPAFRLLGDAYATLGRADDAARAVRTADRLPQYESYLDPLAEALLHESRSTTFLLQQAATADMATNAGWREYLIRRALAFDPDHDVALAELATLYRVVRRYEEALELLERRRRRRPGDFGVLADIGRCLSGLGRYREAEEMLRRALEGLDNAATRYALGLALDGAGRLSEAIAEYRRALDRNPNHPEALNNLGVALAAEGRMDEAARHFERLIALDAGNADAHANLGHALAARGARARAAGAFREALRLDPDHAGARGGLQDIGPR